MQTQRNDFIGLTSAYCVLPTAYWFALVFSKQRNKFKLIHIDQAFIGDF